jgi:1-acyl-sn-glycerol-3-phosphate acyltransferase
MSTESNIASSTYNTSRIPAPTLFNYLHSFLVIPLVYIVTGVMGTISLFASLLDSQGLYQHRCAQIWSRILIRLALTRVTVTGAEKISPTQSYIILASHQSYMDIPATLGFLPTQIRFAAKKELFSIPFLGWHLRRAGHVEIDRSSRADAIAALNRAAMYIRDGVCIILFPEGTRTSDGSLQPFKKGGFKLAIQTHLPILPVTIRGSRSVLPRDSSIFRAGLIEILVDDPIDTTNCSDEDLPMLMESVRESLERNLFDKR